MRPEPPHFERMEPAKSNLPTILAAYLFPYRRAAKNALNCQVCLVAQKSYHPPPWQAANLTVAADGFLPGLGRFLPFLHLTLLPAGLTCRLTGVLHFIFSSFLYAGGG